MSGITVQHYLGDGTDPQHLYGTCVVCTVHLHVCKLSSKCTLCDCKYMYVYIYMCMSGFYNYIQYILLYMYCN